MNRSLLIFIILLIIICNNLYSQNKIFGYIKDRESKNPLEYATVCIFDYNDSIIQGTITNHDGFFNIKNVENGKYIIKVSYLGYFSYTDSINITKKSGDKSCQIDLDIDKNVISEIIINEDRGSYKEFANKSVFIPDSMDITSSIDAKDILKKIPNVIVDDLTNNISILGEKNTLILINGVSVGGRIDLESINPEDIDEIEVINNPMSKYDGEYTAVLNIKLKKNVKQGFEAYNSINILNRNQYEFISVQYGLKNIRFFSHYYYDRTFSYFDINEKRYLQKDDSLVYQSQSDFNPFRKILNEFKFGVDYFINDKNKINFTSKFEGYDYLEKRTTISDANLNNKHIIYNFKGNYKGIENLGNYSLYYNKKFKNEDQELLIDINYYTFKANSDYTINGIMTVKNATSNMDLLQKEDDLKKSLNVKIDFSQPVTDSLIFNIGYNYYNRGLDNKYYSSELYTGFIYVENRNGAYLDAYYNSKKIDISVGTRVEYSSLFINDSTENNVVNFLPSFNITKKFKNKSNIQLSYDKSLSRPDIWSLNPFISYDDSASFSSGNPYLRPAINDYADLSYSYRYKTFLLSSSIFYDYTKDLIDEVSNIDANNVTHETYENLTKNNSYGIKLTISRKLFNILNLKGYTRVYHEEYLYKTISSGGISYNLSVSGNIELKKEIFAGCYFSANGKSFSSQGYYQSAPNFNQIYVGKKIFKDRGSIVLMCFSPLKVENKSYKNGKSFYSEQNTKLKSLLFGFVFKYNFIKGKIDKKIDRDLNMEQDNKN